MTERVDVVVVGGGHTGLSASHFLSSRSIDHVVLERGELANSWRRERWDSLRLLTPNWLNRLPGLPYDGSEPDGYMAASQVVELVERLAAASRAPVRTGTEVTSVRHAGEGLVVTTPGTELRARAVVLASGACNRPRVPSLAARVPTSVVQVTPLGYRHPGQLPEGGVLVVGASATGVQLAAELRRTGRPVTLAVGEHTRLPRTYRGRDVLWWMHETGLWNERYDEVDDLTRARHLPSPQLVGSPVRSTLDLNALTDLGVELVGRLAGLRDGVALFSGGLRHVFSLADLKQQRLLDLFDEWAAVRELDLLPPERFEPTRVPSPLRLRLDLNESHVTSIVWATGYRPSYDWLDIPVVDEKGELRHDGGVVAQSPGLYALGLPVLRRRKSTFLHGAEDDARDVVDHLTRHLGRA